MRRRQFWLLTLLPGLFFIAALAARKIRGAYWLTSYDPDYPYLLNALNILLGNTPGHTDHPGTPLQIWGGLVVGLTYLGQSLRTPEIGLTEFVLQHSEELLININISIVLLISLSLFLVGWVAFQLCGSIFLCVVLQLSPLILNTPIAESTRVTPEPLLFAIAQALVIILLIYLFRPNVLKSLYLDLGLSIILGIGTATKVTFIPATLFLLLLPTLKRKLRAGIITILAFVAATIPILPRYKRVWDWLFSVATHTSNYGTGSRGFIDLSQVSTAFNHLVKQDPFFFVLLGLSVISFSILASLTIIRKLRNRPPIIVADNVPLSRCCVVLGFILLVAIAQTIISFKNPLTRYLISSIALSGLLTFIQLWALINLLSNPSRFKMIGDIHQFVVLPVLVIYLVIGINNYHSYVTASAFNKKNIEGDLQSLTTILGQQPYKNCLKTTLYGSSDQRYALNFGDSFADNRFGNALEVMYPRVVFYNIWTERYSFFSTPIAIDNLLQNECVILRSKRTYQGFLPPEASQKIFEGKVEEAYTLTLP